MILIALLCINLLQSLSSFLVFNPQRSSLQFCCLYWSFMNPISWISCRAGNHFLFICVLIKGLEGGALVVFTVRLLFVCSSPLFFPHILF